MTGPQHARSTRHDRVVDAAMVIGAWVFAIAAVLVGMLIGGYL